MSEDERTLLVDASVFITLAEIGHHELLNRLDGQVWMPATVVREVSPEPAASMLSSVRDEWLNVQGGRGGSSYVREFDSALTRAALHLGTNEQQQDWNGDIALLTYAITLEDNDETVVVITDDLPIRKTCKALSIPVSGSIGILVRSVERGELDAKTARNALFAMDEVGARLSASLVKRAERMIDEAAEYRD